MTGRGRRLTQWPWPPEAAGGEAAVKAAHRLFHARRRRARPPKAAIGGPPEAAVPLTVAAGGGRRQAAGGRRQAAGGRRQAAEGGRQSSPSRFPSPQCGASSHIHWLPTLHRIAYQSRAGGKKSRRPEGPINASYHVTRKRLVSGRPGLLGPFPQNLYPALSPYTDSECLYVGTLTAL